MIRSFRHKGLKHLFEDEDSSKLRQDLVAKIRIVLTAIDRARIVTDLNQPAFRLHMLRGDLEGFWAITVRANWRIIFRFSGSDAFDVDLVDYH
ncbi:MAG TPA: type II toxin-antitoxin system RelE/ParE family toxin [Rhizomicrobium sp.]|nr:type II toxin-antitoxin system RelE/ParE family toxin [Rhizomicrobium sp.]